MKKTGSRKSRVRLPLKLTQLKISLSAKTAITVTLPHLFLSLSSFCLEEKTLPTLAAYTDKKENQLFLIYKEIQNGAVAKSYMTGGLLIYG
jgi:hypothetical protein